MSIVYVAEVKDRVAHVAALKDEIEILKNRFQDYDTGHLKTTVSVLEDRIEELSKWIVQNY